VKLLKLTSNQFSVVAIGVLFLIIALGDARLMFVVSLVGLLVGLGFLRKENEQGSILAITIAFFLMFIIAITLWLKK
jgi:hypothetical protein